jgi:DivIVA domain-containing protein
MTLTPADVHNVVFKKPSIGKRGYDGDEVDAFLDVVETELARLIEENNELRDSGESRAPAVQQPREDQSIRASRMLELAAETADRHVNEAKAQSERLLSRAKSDSERLIADAHLEGEHVIAEARKRADSMMSDARTRAADVEREAQAHAAALEEDARRHVEAISLLEEKRNSLKFKIEELRTAEHESRTRLRSYLQSRLREVDSRGSAEPVSSTRQSQPLTA